LRGKRTQSKALNQALELEASDMAIGMPSWLRQVSLKLNLEKCELFQKEVRYLRHIVSPEGMTTDPKKLKAILEWWTEKNNTKLEAF
jgi:hypothetical protein